MDMRDAIGNIPAGFYTGGARDLCGTEKIEREGMAVWERLVYQNPYATHLFHYCRMGDGSMFVSIFAFYNGRYGGYRVKHCRRA